MSVIGIYQQLSEVSTGKTPVYRSERCPLTACGAPLFKHRNHVFEIGIASAEAPGEPVSTTLGNLLAVRHHVKLTSRARRKQDCDAEALLYEGRETRDLGFIVVSGRTGEYFNLHSVPRKSGQWPRCGAVLLLQVANRTVNEPHRDLTSSDSIWSVDLRR